MTPEIESDVKLSVVTGVSDRRERTKTTPDKTFHIKNPRTQPRTKAHANNVCMCICMYAYVYGNLFVPIAAKWLASGTDDDYDDEMVDI